MKEVTSNKEFHIPVIDNQNNLEIPQVFEIIPFDCCPLAENWQEYLLEDTNQVIWKKFDKKDLINYWYERWVNPRIHRLQDKLESELRP